MEADFKQDQIVWAKINGYPWWPGYIKAVLRKNTFTVAFFGDFSHAKLQSNKIKDFLEVIDRPEKKSKRLSNAIKMAEKIANGESSISKEESRFIKSIEKKPKRNSATQQQNSSREEFESQENDDDDPTFDPKAKATLAERNAFARRISQLSENKLGKQNASGDFISKIKDKRIKSAFLNEQKPSEELFQISSEINLSNFSKSNSIETSQMRAQKTSGKEPTEFEEILKQDLRKEDAQTNEIASDPVHNQTTLFPSFAKQMEFQTELKSEDLEILRKNMSQTIKLLQNENSELKEIISQLRAFCQLFPNPAPIVWDLLTLRLGSSISLIAFLSTERAKDSEYFNSVLDLNHQLIAGIKRALCEAFFRTEEEMLECITLKQQISNFEDSLLPIPVFKRNLSNNSFLRPKSELFKSLSKNSKLNNNSKLMEKKSSHEKSEQAALGESRGQGAGFDLEPRVVFRVCKKIAKAIYLHGGKNTIRKQTCEELANKIEEFVRKNSQSVADYKNKIILLFKNIDKKPEVIQSTFIKNSRGNNMENIYELIQAFINN